MTRARVLVLALVLAGAFAGCLGDEGSARSSLVGYPHHGDVATYSVTGAYVELGRWENGIPFPSGVGRVRLSVAESPDVLDAARAIHPAFLVTSERDSGGGFVKQAERYVSPRHQAVVQAWYPLSQDQATLSFDERGFPWLFGTSALFGADPEREPRVAFTLPDNLGRGADIKLEWVWQGEGAEGHRFLLEGSASVAGELLVPAGSAWPTYARLELLDEGLAPHVRAQSTPARMEARLVSLEEGSTSVGARDRSAGWTDDFSVERLPWDGEKPPGGAPGYVSYPLADAVRDAKLLDQGLAAWLAAASDPRVYRATFQEDPGPLDNTLVPHWLVQFVDQQGAFYEVEVERVTLLQANDAGVPRVTKSGPAEPPADPNHGWFAREAVRDDLVPLSEGIRIVRQVFGAESVQIFLRSFSDPPGYSYFLDGGFDGAGRYTVVYHPSTGLLEQATGPVTPRFAPS